MDRELKEILAAEFVSITGGVLAGIFLVVAKKTILATPGIFILLPGFLGLRGNISGTLAARLGSQLHLGRLKPKFSRQEKLTANVLAAVFLSLVVSLTLGILAFLFTQIRFSKSDPKILIISLLAAFFSNLLMLPATITCCFLLFKKGFDPDNIMSPLISTLGDVICVVSLILAAKILL